MTPEAMTLIFKELKVESRRIKTSFGIIFYPCLYNCINTKAINFYFHYKTVCRTKSTE